MASRLHTSDEKAKEVHKKIQNHAFDNEQGEEYEESHFGGFTDYFRRKKIKLQNLDAELRSTSADKPPIFRGVVAHVNGYTQPSLNDLHNLIVSHGGGFLQYLDGKTMITHIIASSLTPKKRVEFRRYRIVKPAWVVDSVEAGRLLPWDNYRVIDEGAGQRVLGFDHGKVVSQANDQRIGYSDQTDASWYTQEVKDVAAQLATVGDDQTFSSHQRRETSNFQMDSPLPSQRMGNSDSELTQLSLHAEANPKTGDSTAQDRVRSPPTIGSGKLDGNESVLGVDASSRDRFVQEEVERNAFAVVNKQTGSPPKNEKESGSPAGNKTKMTAEEHNAILLSDPHIWKSSTLNPDFLKQFYSESRLHHLSTWKAELKAQMQDLTTEKSLSQKRQRRIPGMRRYIIHVDFDSFFVAVSLKKVPQYSEKPAVVAHGSGSGSEIASCNYAARKFGVKNGMWMKHAQQLCPDLKVLPYDFQGYEEASHNFYNEILVTGGIVQSVSVDEALVDITSLCVDAGGSDGSGVREGSIWREQAKAEEIAKDLRQRIKLKTDCAVSVGIGGNILLAKVALRKAKPAGQYQIKPEEVLDFLGNLVVQDLPGVAYSISGKLEEIGVKFVKDIRGLTKDRLITVLGPKTGEKIWDYSRGIDRAEVGDQVVRKSVSAEVNWDVRFLNQDQAEEFIQSLCGELCRRLLQQKVKGKQFTMKVMRKSPNAPMDPPKHLGHGQCDTFNKSVVLGVATNASEVLGKEAISILRGFAFSPGELRGIGIQMTKLEPIKEVDPARPNGSQQRLQFKQNEKTTHGAEQDPIVDEIDSPKKPKPTLRHPASIVSPLDDAHDNSSKPLNILGTQFLLPSQVDPEVLKELPEDICSRFFRPAKSASVSREVTPGEISRSNSPEIGPEEIPSHSQLDLETLDALPEDVRAEVLEYYSGRRGHGQRLLPQSPRKTGNTRTAVKKPMTPTKKRKSLLFRGAISKQRTNQTLTQSNFVSNRKTTIVDGAQEQGSESEEISAEFLEALPEDIRNEVLDQQRRERLMRKGGLDIALGKKNRAKAGQLPLGQKRLRLPPKPPKPTFTTRKLSALPELRDAVQAWHDEFLEEGPYDEDVKALGSYLAKVITEEKDMQKAIQVVKWMSWVISQDVRNETGKSQWEKALASLQGNVQSAVAERGLGTVEF